jgi:ferrous iron transport protein B
MNNTLALIGNPNSGKTTLFNALTGAYQKTGNWTGVTTEKKIGKYKKDKKILIVDLPGLYSLSAHGEDEQAVTEYLRKTPPSAIINIVDGTNLERNLYLTLELKKLNIPMVIAVNMADELQKNGIKLNAKKRERQ